MTLFPGGIALVESVAQVIQQYNKDKLHNVSVARIDELCKILEKVSGNDVVRDGVLVLAQESQESIWIELFAKVCDVTANSSRRFLEANKNTVLVSVGVKEEELKNAVADGLMAILRDQIEQPIFHFANWVQDVVYYSPRRMQTS